MSKSLASCTVDETANILKVSPATVRRLISRGELRAARVGRSVRIDRAVVERLLKGGTAR